MAVSFTELEAQRMIENGKDLMSLSRSAVLSDKAWSVDPLGHSEFQIRMVVKDGNPTKDTQYKQVIRELWTRWGAYSQVRYELAKTEALIERERARWCFFKWQRMLRDNELSMLLERKESLRLDLEHRILRESEIYMKVMAEVEPAQGERMKVELDNWAYRAHTDPKVRDMLVEQKLLGSRSK